MPLQDISMESTSNSMNTEAPQGGNKKSKRLPPIILTSLVNIIFQKVIKPTAKDKFLLQAIGVGICIVTYCVATYKAILSYLSEHSLHHFTFYPKSNKPIKAVICHLPINTSLDDITLALQELGYDVISVK